MFYAIHPFFQLLQKIFSGIRFHGLPLSRFLTSPTAAQAPIALSRKFAYIDARAIVPFHLNSLKKPLERTQCQLNSRFKLSQLVELFEKTLL